MSSIFSDTSINIFLKVIFFGISFSIVATIIDYFLELKKERLQKKINELDVAFDEMFAEQTPKKYVKWDRKQITIAAIFAEFFEIDGSEELSKYLANTLGRSQSSFIRKVRRLRQVQTGKAKYSSKIDRDISDEIYKLHQKELAQNRPNENGQADRAMLDFAKYLFFKTKY